MKVCAHNELYFKAAEYFGGYDCHCDSNCVYTMYTMNSVFRLKNILVAISATVILIVCTQCTL